MAEEKKGLDGAGWNVVGSEAGGVRPAVREHAD